MSTSGTSSRRSSAPRRRPGRGSRSSRTRAPPIQVPGRRRSAGTRYVHGLAAPSQGGAFHAQVMIVAGRERALVAIGSGEPVARRMGPEQGILDRRDSRPRVVPRARGRHRRLAALPGQPVRTRAAGGERDLPARRRCLRNSPSRPTSWTPGTASCTPARAPAADQLPRGEVDHLLLYSPFHDERTAAVQELIARLRPARVTLAVQSGGRTVIQPGRPAPGHRGRGDTSGNRRGHRGAVPARDAHRGR